jgi:hypothetical protein
MKKGLLVMTIVVVLSFLASMIAVSPSGAAQATKTTPTTRQQTPTPSQSQVYEKAKDKFWSLGNDHCVINGVSVSMNPSTLVTINAKVGQPVTFKSYYKVKTIPIGDITSADAKHWGSGNFTYNNRLRLITGDYAHILKEQTIPKSPPKFTWDDAKNWKKFLMATACKAWTEQMVLTWTPTQVGTSEYFFCSVIAITSNFAESFTPTCGGIDHNYCYHIKIIITP